MAQAYLNFMTYPSKNIIIRNILHSEVTLEMLYISRLDLNETPCQCIHEGLRCASTEVCVKKANNVECPDDCSPICINNNVRNQNWFPGLYTRFRDYVGYGVFTTLEIPPGTFICEMVGEIVKEDEYLRRRDTLYDDFRMFYAVGLSKGFVIDSQHNCGIGSFINSGCNPNCVFRIVYVDGIPRATIWSGENFIHAGSELLYAYDVSGIDFPRPFVCCCGDDDCQDKNFHDFNSDISDSIWSSPDLCSSEGSVSGQVSYEITKQDVSLSMSGLQNEDSSFEGDNSFYLTNATGVVGGSHVKTPFISMRKRSILSEDCALSLEPKKKLQA